MKLYWKEHEVYSEIHVANIRNHLTAALIKSDDGQSEVFWEIVPREGVNDWINGAKVSIMGGQEKDSESAKARILEALAYLDSKKISLGSVLSARGRNMTRVYPVEFYKDDGRVMLVPPHGGTDLDVTDFEEAKFLQNLEDGEIDVEFGYYFSPAEKSTRSEPGSRASVEVHEIFVEVDGKKYDLDKIFEQKTGKYSFFELFEERILEDTLGDGPDD